MFEVKIGDGTVQVTAGGNLVTLQRFDANADNLDVCLARLDDALTALRHAAAEVVSSSWRHHRVAAAQEATAGWTR